MEVKTFVTLAPGNREYLAIKTKYIFEIPLPKTISKIVFFCFNAKIVTLNVDGCGLLVFSEAEQQSVTKIISMAFKIFCHT